MQNVEIQKLPPPPPPPKKKKKKKKQQHYNMTDESKSESRYFRLFYAKYEHKL